jgi:hypothetical protein
MRVLEEVRGRDAVVPHHPEQGRAITLPVVLPQRAGGDLVEPDVLDEIGRHGVADAGERAWLASCSVLSRSKSQTGGARSRSLRLAPGRREGSAWDPRRRMAAPKGLRRLAGFNATGSWFRTPLR